MRDQRPIFEWPRLDENEAAGLCYTSGTTGDPKGVLYSHRSTTLHTFACLFADGIGMRERDVCMPAVPMFHANAWGFPYAALMAGAALALPCHDRSSEPDRIDRACRGHHGHRRADGLARFPRSAEIGQPCVAAHRYAQALADRRRGRQPGVDRWVCRFWHRRDALLGNDRDIAARVDQCRAVGPRYSRAKRDPNRAGIAYSGIALRIVDDKGARARHDGAATGELQVNSPWAAAAYFKGTQSADGIKPVESFVLDEGREWLRTGDIATIDPHGYVRIVDRAKDLIKSGGEWISSQALELQLMNHPDVREAAAVGRPDPKWQERPVACVALHHDTPDTRARFALQFDEYLSASFPKWQIPDEVIFWSELPKGKTGKIDKIALRKHIAEFPA